MIPDVEGWTQARSRSAKKERETIEKFIKDKVKKRKSEME